jgi:pilus assembly protein FimV
LALAVVLLRARRRDAESLPETRLAMPTVAAALPAAAAHAPIVAPRLSAAVESVAEFDDAWSPPDADAEAPADEDFTAFADGAEPEPKSQTGDVIGEAEIYIAYGRYAQAVTLLNGVLVEDPLRYDVRLKLLEIHADTGDRSAFDAAMTELLAQCDEEEVLFAARDLESRLPRASERPPIPSLQPEPEPTAPAATDPVAAAKTPDPEDGDQEIEDVDQEIEDVDQEIGFELEIDKFEVGAPLLSDDRLTEDLGGDLGLNFDPGEPPEDNGDLGAPLLDLDEAVGPNEFEADGDNASTKLDLARAYLDMGDEDGAREILGEVLSEGNEEQRSSARKLLDQAGR